MVALIVTPVVIPLNHPSSNPESLGVNVLGALSLQIFEFLFWGV